METFNLPNLTSPTHEPPLLYKTKPFTCRFPHEQLQALQHCLKAGSIAPEAFENLHEDAATPGVGPYGLSRRWLVEAKRTWEDGFDWRQTENHINSFNNYKVPIQDDDGEEFTIHFVGMFSAKEDAVPIVFMHGWPGCFLEFLPLLTHLQNKYKDPAQLPYHIVVPSLPGYTFSSGPSLKKDSDTRFMAQMMHKLMEGLGFDDHHGGYVAQGGDLGSSTANIMSARYAACKAVHLNFFIVPRPEGVTDQDLTEAEKLGLPRGADFLDVGIAYAKEHGTRPGTLGLVLSSSPIAVLSWVGEKFLAWKDPKSAAPSVKYILEIVTLYWLTDTIHRCLYPYRPGNRSTKVPAEQQELFKSIVNNEKPVGFSWFPWELYPTPVAYVKEYLKGLVWSRRHEDGAEGGEKSGGHFAALERPETLAQDVEDFVAEVWPKTKTGSGPSSTPPLR